MAGRATALAIPAYKLTDLPMQPPATADIPAQLGGRSSKASAMELDDDDDDAPEGDNGGYDADSDREEDESDTRANNTNRTARRARAAARAQRAAARDQARPRFPTGRYDTSVGPVTVSGVNRQRIAQTRSEDYGGNTMGSIPPYSQINANLNYDHATNAIFDPDFVSSVPLNDRQRMATALVATTSNVSEGDKIPGYPKYMRSVARRFDQDSTLPHPMSPTANPASQVGGAARARTFMAQSDNWDDDQIDAWNEASPSSSDDSHFALRSGMLTSRIEEPRAGRARRRRARPQNVRRRRFRFVHGQPQQFRLRRSGMRQR